MPDDSAVTRRPVPDRRRVLAATAVALTALAGCSSGDSDTPTPGEGTTTVRLENRDDVAREYRVVVQQGETLRDEFSGTLPAGERVEMVATFRITDAQYSFAVDTDGGQRGRTWDPTECADFLVEAFIEGGEPGFEAGCRDQMSLGRGRQPGGGSRSAP